MSIFHFSGRYSPGFCLIQTKVIKILMCSYQVLWENHSSRRLGKVEKSFRWWQKEVHSGWSSKLENLDWALSHGVLPGWLERKGKNKEKAKKRFNSLLVLFRLLKLLGSLSKPKSSIHQCSKAHCARGFKWIAPCWNAFFLQHREMHCNYWLHRTEYLEGLWLENYFFSTPKEFCL